MNHGFALAARMQPYKRSRATEYSENHGKHYNNSAAHNVPAALTFLKILRAGFRRKLHCHTNCFPGCAVSGYQKHFGASWKSH